MNKVILTITLLAATYAITVASVLNDWTVPNAANLGYYLLLLLNTYFSLTFTEREYHIRNRRDGVLNLLLTALYLTLPWFVTDTLRFHLYMAAFFAVAVVKYAYWLKVPEAAFFLKRKIPINASGALLSSVAAIFMNGLGDTYAMQVAWGAFAFFGGANIVVLLVDPLYRAQ